MPSLVNGATEKELGATRYHLKKKKKSIFRLHLFFWFSKANLELFVKAKQINIYGLNQFI